MTKATKIALCMPMHGDAKALFVVSLARMIARTLSVEIEQGGTILRPEIEVFQGGGADLAGLRSNIAAQAIGWGADYLLWLDNDMTHPSGTLARWLALNLPVVGANYATRARPAVPTAKRFSGDDFEHVWTTKADADAQRVEEIDSLGLGLVLIRADVFAKIEPPWFAFTHKPTGEIETSEDVHLFRKLRAAGVPVHLDHLISWNVGHIGQTIMTHATVEADRVRVRPGTVTIGGDRVAVAGRRGDDGA